MIYLFLYALYASTQFIVFFLQLFIMPMHAVNVDGAAYRSYRLIEVEHKNWTDKSIRHCAVNKKKNAESKSTHLGPHRAAQKIFDAWCRTNKINHVDNTRFIIQETTRGKKNKLFVYDGKRVKLNIPRIVTVHNKKSNTDNTITYEYQSKVKAYKKSELQTKPQTNTSTQKTKQKKPTTVSNA